MQAVNAAAAEALRRIAARDAPRAANEHQGVASDSPTPQTDWAGATRDVPSFTVEALPVETFEALLLATKELGEVEDDDPPYELRVLLADPLACWCQLDVVPDAGASTVSISIATVEGAPLPPLVEVRNAWIAVLNGLDWSTL